MRRIIGYIFAAGTMLAVLFIINYIGVAADQQTTKLKKVVSDARQVYTKDGEVFSSHLPVVVIDTGGRRIEKDTETWAEITVINPSTSNKHNLTAAAMIKYRGNTSYKTFDKKQYHIEFRKGYGEKESKNYSVMCMSAASDWVLNAPFLDRSLIRNRLVYAISREILSWAPDTCYCEVFLNGEYQGLYLMIEPITNEIERLNLAKFGLLSGQTTYILKRDLKNTEENEIDTYGTKSGKTGYQVSISYPSLKHLTEPQRQWIVNDINEFERALYSDQFDDPDYGYTKYIDVDSFVDYYIINEFTLTTDASYLSTYVYKDIGEKLKMTVWDFNNSFDNYQTGAKSIDKFYVAKSNWYNRLFNDRKFTDAVVTQYRELRKGILSEKNLLELVDGNVAYLGDAVDRNFKIWGYTFNENLLPPDELGNSRDPKSYDEAVQQLKNCIIARGNFLDKNIEELYQYAVN